jgi:TolA-binding protein
MRVKKLYLFLGISLCLAAFSNVSAEEVVTDVKGFEGMVKKWIDLRTELQSEERDWKIKKENIKNQLELFAKEKESLEKEIKSMRQDMTTAQEEQAKLSSQLEANQKTLDSLDGGIQRAEKRLLVLVKSIPEPLLTGLKKNIKSLTNTGAMSFTQRAQNILALYSEIERIQASVHIVRELIEIEGGEKKEFDVVYLGLAEAFCVSSDGRNAGFGKPGIDGWKWQWNNSLAKEISKAVRIVKQKKPAEFLSLPLLIKEEVL